MWYRFFIDLSKSAPGEIYLSVYDYTFFGDIRYSDGKPVKLTFDPVYVHPTYQIVENKDNSVYSNPLGAAPSSLPFSLVHSPFAASPFMGSGSDSNRKAVSQTSPVRKAAPDQRLVVNQANLRDSLGSYFYEWKKVARIAFLGNSWRLFPPRHYPRNWARTPQNGYLLAPPRAQSPAWEPALLLRSSMLGLQ